MPGLGFGFAPALAGRPRARGGPTAISALSSEGSTYSLPLTVLDDAGNAFTVSTVVFDSDGNSSNVS